MTSDKRKGMSWGRLEGGYCSSSGPPPEAPRGCRDVWLLNKARSSFPYNWMCFINVKSGEYSGVNNQDIKEEMAVIVQAADNR